MSDGSRRLAGDLSSCDRESIHTPGSVQPHGVLLALCPDTLEVLQISENVRDVFAFEPDQVLGNTVALLLGDEQLQALRDALPALPELGEPILLRTFRRNDRWLSLVMHRTAEALIIEAEAIPDDTTPAATQHALHPLVAAFIAQVQSVNDTHELCRLVAAEVRRVTGFDRALVYRFDDDGTGIVLAEDRNQRFPSLQDHRFPASDVPRQARELYRVNRLRLIPDANYRPARLVPELYPPTGRPLDMSHATLRSVSPVHVEYMRNMATAASMSVSILSEGKLWGLVSCHHSAPRIVPFEARTACDLLAQVFSLQLAAQIRAADVQRRVELQSVLTRLLADMAEADDFAEGLTRHSSDLLDFVRAAGAAVVSEHRCQLVGTTPNEREVRQLAEWLWRDRDHEVFSTNSLATTFPPAASYADKASGLLAVSVSQLHPQTVLWFRPEVIDTIRWGGDPRAAKTQDADTGRINPRKSFETWRETVRLKAPPWLPSEVAAASDLRNAIHAIVLRRAEELAALSTELGRSNRDLEVANRELEAFSYSVSHDLRAPLRHIVGYAEMLKDGIWSRENEPALRYINAIIESCEYAGKLVDNLLALSRMGRVAMTMSELDLGALVRNVQEEVMQTVGDRQIRWTIGELPRVQADLLMLRLAVLNLFSNAVKYTKTRREATIDVSCRQVADEFVISVADNGVGFDMRYRDKLFGVFQRLHRWEEYEGTGIGLANVRRIIERHGGRVWAEGQVDVGATFHFTLPAAAK